MLTIMVPGGEEYDSERNLFNTYKDQTLVLEHSLVSISKWESKWHKPFLTKDPKTEDETLDYIRCMTINTGVDPATYRRLTPSHINQIQEYINDPMTATWFSDKQKQKPNREIITSELIYYWMVALQIPFECQKWHLNRLLTLIQVCNIKNQPAKKMSKRDIMAQNRSLNASRIAALKRKAQEQML